MLPRDAGAKVDWRAGGGFAIRGLTSEQEIVSAQSHRAVSVTGNNEIKWNET